MSQKENSPVLFKTPFSPAYWRCAAGELKNLRVLALTALFVGLRVVLAALFIPVGENLRIHFSFFINALSCYISGPILALISGFASDILGYWLYPIHHAGIPVFCSVSLPGKALGAPHLFL